VHVLLTKWGEYCHDYRCCRYGGRHVLPNGGFQAHDERGLNIHFPACVGHAETGRCRNNRCCHRIPCRGAGTPFGKKQRGISQKRELRLHSDVRLRRHRFGFSKGQMRQDIAHPGGHSAVYRRDRVGAFGSQQRSGYAHMRRRNRAPHTYLRPRRWHSGFRQR